MLTLHIHIRIYIYIYIHIYIHIYTCIHVYIYACIHVYIYACIHVAFAVDPSHQSLARAAQYEYIITSLMDDGGRFQCFSLRSPKKNEIAHPSQGERFCFFVGASVYASCGARRKNTNRPPVRRRAIRLFCLAPPTQTRANSTRTRDGRVGELNI